MLGSLYTPAFEVCHFWPFQCKIYLLLVNEQRYLLVCGVYYKVCVVVNVIILDRIILSMLGCIYTGGKGGGREGGIVIKDKVS